MAVICDPRSVAGPQPKRLRHAVTSACGRRKCDKICSLKDLSHFDPKETSSPSSRCWDARQKTGFQAAGQDRMAHAQD